MKERPHLPIVAALLDPKLLEWFVDDPSSRIKSHIASHFSCTHQASFSSSLYYEVLFGLDPTLCHEAVML